MKVSETLNDVHEDYRYFGRCDPLVDEVKSAIPLAQAMEAVVEAATIVTGSQSPGCLEQLAQAVKHYQSLHTGEKQG